MLMIHFPDAVPHIYVQQKPVCACGIFCLLTFMLHYLSLPIREDSTIEAYGILELVCELLHEVSGWLTSDKGINHIRAGDERVLSCTTPKRI